MSASISWILILCTFAVVVTETEGTTCSYYENGYTHYIHCPHSDCCGTYSYKYCCAQPAEIVGAVIGCVAFVVIVASIVTCFCCACCPVYRYRTNQGMVISTHQAGPNYQTMPGTYPQSTPGPYTAKPAGEYTAPPPYQV